MGAGLRPTAKAVDKPPDPTGGAPPADSTSRFSVQTRGGAVPGSPDATADPIRFGVAPGPDPAHRVGPLRGGESKETGLGEAGDVRLSGPDALLHGDPEGRVSVGTPARPKAGGAPDPAHPGGAPSAVACRPARERPVAEPSPSGRALLLRGTGQYPVSQRLGLRGQASVSASPAPAVPKGSYHMGAGGAVGSAPLAARPPTPPVVGPTAGRLTGGRSRMHERARPDRCGGPGATRVPTAICPGRVRLPSPTRTAIL